VPDKLKTLDELKGLVSEAKSSGKKIVFTNGCFDLLHPGHLYVLRQAKAAGDILIVGLNSDRSVKALKGPARPVVPEKDRSELIAALEMVDYVILFDELDPQRIIAALNPEVLAKGGDWDKEKIIGAEIVQKQGGKIVVIPYLPGYSTTAMIERIRS
jgi:D-beta-D-heptose 7-phosphate kinase/D-beta-D-heptose 1-phosphate adenosyltransferase